MTGDDQGGLPPVLATAWGLRGRPNKGPRPGLSVERVVAAAIGVARRNGLAAVSMSRVAKELDTVAMALYRYVSSKNELVTLMVDAVNGLPPDLPDPDDTWREALRAWTQAMLDIARADPWTLEVPVAGPPMLPNAVDWFEAGLRCLSATPLDPGEKVQVLSAVSGLARTQALFEAQIGAALEASAPTSVPGGYAAMLSAVLPPGRYPELREVIAADPFGDDAGAPGDEDFDFGLDVMLDGIERLIDRRA